MGPYRGLVFGVAGLAFMAASLHLMAGLMARLPWTRLAAPPAAEPELIAPRVERSPHLERGLLPSARTESGTVPLYRESRPAAAAQAAPVRAPGYSAGADWDSAPQPEVKPPARPGLRAPKAGQPRFRLDNLPALGERFGAAAPEGQGQAAAPARPTLAPAVPAPPPGEAEPAQAAGWDSASPAAAPEAASRQRRPMRAVLQGGVATTPVEEEAPAEEPQE